MNYYTLNENDHARHSWVLITEEKAKPRARPPEVPEVVHQLLGAPVPAGLRFKPRYARFRCGLCRRFDGYAVFDEGFDDNVKIRIKGDFGHSTDRIFVVNDRFLAALQSVNTSGYETKALGQTGWHALRITAVVTVADSAFGGGGGTCPECGRLEFAGVGIERISQITPPERAATLFTHSKSWPDEPMDRMPLLTEPVVQALKEHGIKGGYCNRLFTDEEWAKLKLNPLGILVKRPKGSQVFL